MTDWIKPQWDTDHVVSTSLKGTHLESTAIKQVQQPELSLSAEIEPFAKGGWKKTIRASVRTFDGKHEDLYDQLSMMLANGLAIAAQAIDDHEKATKEATTNE